MPVRLKDVLFVVGVMIQKALSIPFQNFTGKNFTLKIVLCI